MPRLPGSKNKTRLLANPNLDEEIMFHIWKIVEIVRADAKVRIAEALVGKSVKTRKRGAKKPKQGQGHKPSQGS